MEPNHKLANNTNGLERSPGRDATPSTSKENETSIAFEATKPLRDTNSKDENEDSFDDFNDDEDVDEEEIPKHSSWLGRGVLLFQRGTRKMIEFFDEKFHGYFFVSIVALLYFAYFAYAMYYRFGDEGSIRLLWCTVLGVMIACRHKAWQLLARTRTCTVQTYDAPAKPSAVSARWIKRLRFVFRWLMNAALGAVMVYVIVDVALKNPTRLVSLAGVVVFLLVCYLVSSNPSKVNWHTIYWSLGLQLILSLLIMKWQGGRQVVLWIQTRLDGFFGNAKPSSILLFGETYNDHYIVFGALPIVFLTNATLSHLGALQLVVNVIALPIVFLTNATLSMMYHLGAMQLVVKVIGSTLHFCLGTSVVESTGVAASIFMEGAGALLSIRPYLSSLGKSELFALTTACLSSIGGAYLALLSQIGVPIEFMLPAMVISAPANFAVCKLVVPDTRKARKVRIDAELPPEMRHATILEAAQVGALSVVSMLVNVIVSAFAFFSLISWINTTLTWFGFRVGIQDLTMEKILSYVFFPISYLMGIEVADCRNVAMLMGLRISSASLVSMLKLMQLLDNRDQFDQYSQMPNATVTYVGDHIVLDQWNTTLIDGFISKRSEAIAIYALCGFSSVLSLFITLSIMDSLNPKSHTWLAKRAFPLVIAGNFSNFLVGCFAGECCYL
ncbi:hypothetical protein ACOMHN_053207 [Nucella lapillus]